MTKSVKVDLLLLFILDVSAEVHVLFDA